MGVNAHRAFENSGSESYRKNLNPDPEHIEELRDARNKIRATLTSTFASWERRIDAGILFEDVAVASFAEGFAKPRLSPKFRGQGSYVYHTLNRPTHNPPQEMDFDEGMFLPSSFVTLNGHAHPIVASEGYFRLVEEALAPLCRSEGWTLNPERPRPSCVRVSLNNKRSHIDIALYAIPDDEFEVLVEKAARSVHSSFGDSAHASAILLDEIYKTITLDRIMLAHRDEGWKISDPRKLEDWFLTAVKKHGEQVRRLSRYLKGWRDHRWEKCRLSSIALMACVVRYFDEAGASVPARDDASLAELTRKLPQYLRGEIRNPVVEGRLDEGWDDGNAPLRPGFVQCAEELRDDVAAALAATDRTNAKDRLCRIFGMHFPDDPALIEIDGGSSAAILSSGVLGSLGAASDAQSAVKIGGDERFG